MLKMVSYIVETLGKKRVYTFSFQESDTTFLQTSLNTKDLSSPREYYMHIYEYIILY